MLYRRVTIHSSFILYYYYYITTIINIIVYCYYIYIYSYIYNNSVLLLYLYLQLYSLLLEATTITAVTMPTQSPLPCAAINAHGAYERWLEEAAVEQYDVAFLDAHTLYFAFWPSASRCCCFWHFYGTITRTIRTKSFYNFFQKVQL